MKKAKIILFGTLFGLFPGAVTGAMLALTVLLIPLEAIRKATQPCPPSK